PSSRPPHLTAPPAAHLCQVTTRQAAASPSWGRPARSSPAAPLPRRGRPYNRSSTENRHPICSGVTTWSAQDLRRDGRFPCHVQAGMQMVELMG
ncbi:MAG: hypothetical protein ACHRXM_33800, partial [Isosphaerales bacterium]